MTYGAKVSALEFIEQMSHRCKLGFKVISVENGTEFGSSSALWETAPESN